MARVNKNNYPLIPILCFSVVFLGFIAYLFSAFQKNGLISSNLMIPLEYNEDVQSQTTIPQDVLSAIDSSKTKGLPVLGVRADGPSYRIPVLMYHYVEYVKDKNDTFRQKMNVPPNILDAQIKTLKDAGYTFIDASDFADILDGIKEVPQKPIILTFDDGHDDFYTDAFPILKKYNVKSVQYVITGFLNKPDFMTDSQLLEISKSSIVEIGAHTVNHVALKGASDTTLKKEMLDSKIYLETKLGKSITAFAYPFGSFDLRAIQIAKMSGFRTSMSTIPGSNQENASRFFVNRIRPGWATGKSLLDLVSSK